MVGFNMRHMNIFRTMKEIADSGAIGEIRAVWVRHFVGSGGRWYFHDWHANRKTSTSLLLQKASHDIDMIHWITGKYTRRVAAFGSLDFYGGNKPNKLECPSCPEKDTCTEYQEWPHHQFCCFRKEVSVEDNSMMMMELDTGIKATYTQCHFTPDYFRNYTFIGTEGRIENMDDSTKVICLTRTLSKKSKNLANRTYDVKPAEGSHGGADPEICKDFIDMITTGKYPVSTPAAGRMSVAVGCAATESLRHGGKVIAIFKTDHRDRLGPQASDDPGGIHGGIASADDNDFPLGIENCFILLSLLQKFNTVIDTVQILAIDTEPAAQRRADTDENRIVIAAYSVE